MLLVEEALQLADDLGMDEVRERGNEDGELAQAACTPGRAEALAVQMLLEEALQLPDDLGLDEVRERGSEDGEPVQAEASSVVPRECK